eukprot:TRINITY_DN17736_c0_g1_i1.p1 TRINITY_DN17736_c0_g1~~TRINITY_DN17736_c0_g1_i1.p1  ORF type:complete len:263 (+),score=40.87 TRINITY_DN17736_c0_g1_i1:60-791(+)
MKGLFVSVIILSLALYTCSVELSLQQYAQPVLKKTGVGADPALCPTCVEFMSEAISELLNIIANGGVIGGCGELCSLIPLGGVEIAVCNLLCDIVGIEAFITLIDDVDPDPVWICMELDVCPINDNAAANILSLTVNPGQGPQGTTFEIDMVYNVTNTIATGQAEFLILPPGAMPFGTGGLLVEQKPAVYRVGLKFTATPSESEPFMAGKYKVQAAVCEGSCGSIHSHSKVLSVSASSFNITQ